MLHVTDDVTDAPVGPRQRSSMCVPFPESISCFEDEEGEGARTPKPNRFRQLAPALMEAKKRLHRSVTDDSKRHSLRHFLSRHRHMPTAVTPPSPLGLNHVWDDASLDAEAEEEEEAEQRMAFPAMEDRPKLESVASCPSLHERSKTQHTKRVSRSAGDMKKLYASQAPRKLSPAGRSRGGVIKKLSQLSSSVDSRSRRTSFSSLFPPSTSTSRTSLEEPIEEVATPLYEEEEVSACHTPEELSERKKKGSRRTLMHALKSLLPSSREKSSSKHSTRELTPTGTDHVRQRHVSLPSKRKSLRTVVSLDAVRKLPLPDYLDQLRYPQGLNEAQREAYRRLTLRHDKSHRERCDSLRVFAETFPDLHARDLNQRLEAQRKNQAYFDWQPIDKEDVERVAAAIA